MPRLLPEGWINSYVRGIQPISEAPQIFNLWAAIGVVGAALKNNVKLLHGTYTIYPNMYIVFVAPPGIGKGSAMHPALYYIKENLQNGTGSLCNIMSDRITAPRIIEKLALGVTTLKPHTNTAGTITFAQAIDSSVMLQSTELSTLLTSSDWMMQFLCDAWDRNEFLYDTKNKGTNVIKGMCVSLMGACVPEYIRKLNKDATAAINGGFTARTVFVYSQEAGTRISFPETQNSTLEGQLLIDNLKHDLEEISKLQGVFTYTAKAKQLFNQFYMGDSCKHNEVDSDVITHFKSRLAVHVRKLAMVFSASVRDDLVIDEYDITNSILFMEQIRANLDAAFKGVGNSVLAEATANVSRYIEKKGTASRNQILAAVHKNVTPEDLDRVLMILVSIGEVTVQYSGQNAYFTRVGAAGVAQAPTYHTPPNPLPKVI